MTILNFDDINRSKYFKAKVRYLKMRDRALYISLAKEYYVGTKMLGKVWRILNRKSCLMQKVNIENIISEYKFRKQKVYSLDGNFDK